jgi:hypothetical protein
VKTTWYNTIAEFPDLLAGVTYMPIPCAGVMLLFVIERLWVGDPPATSFTFRDQPGEANSHGRPLLLWSVLVFMFLGMPVAYAMGLADARHRDSGSTSARRRSCSRSPTAWTTSP